MASKAGKFEYAGRNSKGEVKLRRATNQSLEETLEFLESKGIEYDVPDKGYCLAFDYKDATYQYFWTTGRWGMYWNGYGNKRFKLPSKHYMSESIEMLIETLDKPSKTKIWQPPKEEV